VTDLRGAAGWNGSHVVNDKAPPRSGIFLVAAWREAGGQPVVRARINSTPDVSRAPTAATVTASVDEACILLRRWWSAVADE
jgi:hypothetical protein